MICCDRCEEWFHGDCVGISEARGRLMERNGEDYVCPNCYTQKGQISKSGSSTAAAENGKRPVAGLRKTETGLTTASSTFAASTEEKASDDLGIKGRIEKATNPSGKKKIKIFQPVCLRMKHEFEYCTFFFLFFFYTFDFMVLKNTGSGYSYQCLVLPCLNFDSLLSVTFFK